MPELPEVERAASLLRDITSEQSFVRHVESSEDNIVYTSGITHDEFAQELKGRRVTNVSRYGKVFYLELDGKGRNPVLHFGMTGMLQVKGNDAAYYRKKPKTATIDWPPRFVKFILHFAKSEQSSVDEDVLVAFLDPRRLGRIRLCASPRDEPPISTLGFDPLINMPSLDKFSALVRPRRCPIKALLLDQSFSAGVGNWVADEILYHARVHPEQRADTLDDATMKRLHHWIVEVPRFAVSVNADDGQFPENWLFRHRWDKGKKRKDADAVEPLKLPSGKPATIKWITVGGRTSAYVTELQHIQNGADPDKDNTDNPASNKKTSKRARSTRQVQEEQENADSANESELTPLSDEEPLVLIKRPKRSASRKR